jgi:hypothetical protein
VCNIPWGKMPGRAALPQMWQPFACKGLELMRFFSKSVVLLELYWPQSSPLAGVELSFDIDQWADAVLRHDKSLNTY